MSQEHHAHSLHPLRKRAFELSRNPNEKELSTRNSPGLAITVAGNGISVFTNPLSPVEALCCPHNAGTARTSERAAMICMYLCARPGLRRRRCRRAASALFEHRANLIER